ncbi:hypothetical protein C8E01_10153 [Pontibacter virosus]|uniref:Uncharacterized protein n=1 Tax=Pontibacter virosus TaxID=1765052 RepID=A0A2U1B5A1_9BACT|nr:hypothetical protein C8E01_10153 [Pontibacter virosus]
MGQGLTQWKTAFLSELFVFVTEMCKLSFLYLLLTNHLASLSASCIA